MWNKMSSCKLIKELLYQCTCVYGSLEELKKNLIDTAKAKQTKTNTIEYDDIYENVESPRDSKDSH